MVLLLFRTSLGDSQAELSHRIDRTFEAEPIQCHVVDGPRLNHQATDEVVGDQEHFQLLMHHLRALAAQDLHAHGGFEVAKPQFDFPAPDVEFGDVLGRVILRVQ